VEVDGRRRRRFSLRRGGPATPRTDVLSRADRTGSAVDALKGSGPRPAPTCYPDPMPVSETPPNAWTRRGGLGNSACARARETAKPPAATAADGAGTGVVN
jgi:hypothetical protein